MILQLKVAKLWCSKRKVEKFCVFFLGRIFFAKNNWNTFLKDYFVISKKKFGLNFFRKNSKLFEIEIFHKYKDLAWIIDL